MVKDSNYINIPGWAVTKLGLKGNNLIWTLPKISFLLTTFREFVLVLIFAYLLGFVFNMGERGIYYGMLIGGFLGSVIAYGYIEYYVDRLIKGKIKGSNI